MFPKLIPALVGLLWVPAFTLAAPKLKAAKPSPVQKTLTQFQDLLNSSNAAAMHGKVGDALSLYTVDFVAVDIKGKKSNLSAMRQNLRGIVHIADSYQCVTLISQLTVQGKVATTETVDHQDIISWVRTPLPGAQSLQHMKHTIDSWSCDSWVQTAQGWKIKRSQLLRQQESLQRVTP